MLSKCTANTIQCYRISTTVCEWQTESSDTQHMPKSVVVLVKIRTKIEIEIPVVLRIQINPSEMKPLDNNRIGLIQCKCYLNLEVNHLRSPPIQPLHPFTFETIQTEFVLTLPAIQTQCWIHSSRQVATISRDDHRHHCRLFIIQISLKITHL